MKKLCSKCGAQLDSQWSFCPYCGSLMAIEAEEPPEHEITSTPGAFGGLLFGVLAVPILVIVGTMLCLTGLGAILGIPMLIGAVFAPLLGPMFGMRAHRGRCPSCGVVVGAITDMEKHECPVCNQPFAVTREGHVKAA